MNLAGTPSAAGSDNGLRVDSPVGTLASDQCQGERHQRIARAKEYLASARPSISGERGHDRCFAVASSLLHRFRLAPEDALTLLEEWNTRCVPPWTGRELLHKVRSALAAGGLSPFYSTELTQTKRLGVLASANFPKPRQRRCVFDAERLAVIAAKAPMVDMHWLAATSPIRPDNRTPASFLHALYDPGERVLVFDIFESQGQHLWCCKKSPFDARELDGFRLGKPSGVWFLTNPVDGQWRCNDTGNCSRRSWQNVTAFRYLLLESDHADAADWQRALVQMPLRISAIYTSGGKSIHALVRLDASSRDEWNEAAARLKPILTVLGADPKSMSAVRLSRLPHCERGGPDRLQRLLYLNPRPEAAPIFTACERREL